MFVKRFFVIILAAKVLFMLQANPEVISGSTSKIGVHSGLIPSLRFSWLWGVSLGCIFLLVLVLLLLLMLLLTLWFLCVWTCL